MTERAPNDAPHMRTITMSEFQWGQLDLLVRNELRLEESRAEMARKAPDRRVAADRADQLREMQAALRNWHSDIRQRTRPETITVKSQLGEDITLTREGDRLYISGDDADDQGRVWLKEIADQQQRQIEVRGPSLYHEGRVYSPRTE